MKYLGRGLISGDGFSEELPNYWERIWNRRHRVWHYRKDIFWYLLCWVGLHGWGKWNSHLSKPGMLRVCWWCNVEMPYSRPGEKNYRTWDMV